MNSELAADAAEKMSVDAAALHQFDQSTSCGKQESQTHQGHDKGKSSQRWTCPEPSVLLKIRRKTGSAECNQCLCQRGCCSVSSEAEEQITEGLLCFLDQRRPFVEIGSFILLLTCSARHLEKKTKKKLIWPFNM